MPDTTVAQRRHDARVAGRRDQGDSRRDPGRYGAGDGGGRGGNECLLIAREFSLYDKLPLVLVRGDADARAGAAGGGRSGGRVGAGPTGEVSSGRHAAKSLSASDSQTLRVAGVVNEYTAGGLMVYIDRAAAKKKFDITGVDAYLISTVHPTPPAWRTNWHELADRDGLLLHSFTRNSRSGSTTWCRESSAGLWVLLALGLLVGALGVVNTLTMNVLEQTQELGMLRAIGMPRGQLMRTVLARPC